MTSAPKDKKETDEPVDGMTRVGFSIPIPLAVQLAEIAKNEGWRLAELHRIVWVLGLSAYAEQSNKSLVNAQLRAKAKAHLKLEDSES